jgi:FMN phosphatase YigB (HAD superfamily)
VIKTDDRMTLCGERFQALLVDLRGTLAATPSVTQFVPEQIAQGLPPRIAQHAQRRLDLLLKATTNPHRVIDWTRFAANTLRHVLRSQGYAIDAARVVVDFGLRYLSQSKELVSLDLLSAAAATLSNHGLVAVIADGPVGRERRLMQHLWGQAGLALPLICSETVGVNKLHPSFYLAAAWLMRVEPARILVVGDRIDKDVRPAETAGCRGLLVESQLHSGEIRLDQFWTQGVR